MKQNAFVKVLEYSYKNFLFQLTVHNHDKKYEYNIAVNCHFMNNIVLAIQTRHL